MTCMLVEIGQKFRTHLGDFEVKVMVIEIFCQSFWLKIL